MKKNGPLKFVLGALSLCIFVISSVVGLVSAVCSVVEAQSVLATKRMTAAELSRMNTLPELNSVQITDYDYKLIGTIPNSDKDSTKPWNGAWLQVLPRGDKSGRSIFVVDNHSKDQAMLDQFSKRTTLDAIVNSLAASDNKFPEIDPDSAWVLSSDQPVGASFVVTMVCVSIVSIGIAILIGFKCGDMVPKRRTYVWWRS